MSKTNAATTKAKLAVLQQELDTQQHTSICFTHKRVAQFNLLQHSSESNLIHCEEWTKGYKGRLSIVAYHAVKHAYQNAATAFFWLARLARPFVYCPAAAKVVNEMAATQRKEKKMESM